MKNIYEIPKLEVQVEICLINKESLRGKIFIPEEMGMIGPEPSIEVFLSKVADKFIPFESGLGSYRLINKDQVTFIRTFQTNEEIKSRTPLDPQSLVVYFSNGQNVFGFIYPTQAEETRVSDILNQGDHFFAMYHEEQKIVINRNHIIYVGSN